MNALFSVIAKDISFNRSELSNITMIQDFEYTNSKQMSLFDSYRFGGLFKFQIFNFTAYNENVTDIIPQIYFEESSFKDIKYGYRRYYNKSDPGISKPP